MREGGGNPLEAWFTDVPLKYRRWLVWITIGVMAFGSVMTILWLRGG